MIITIPNLLKNYNCHSRRMGEYLELQKFLPGIHRIEMTLKNIPAPHTNLNLG